MPYEKVGKNEPVCIADEIPFEIPDTWEWVRLGNIGETNIGLTYKPADVCNSGIGVLRSNNIQNGMMDYSDLIYVSCDVPIRAMAQKGDILICARNGSRALVGKSAIVDRDGMAFGAFMAIFRSICNPYIQLFINSYLFRGQLDGATTTTINQVTQSMLRKQLCPLPPLEEQKRIVEKYNELLPLITKYEKVYTSATKLQNDFPIQLRRSILQWAVQGKLVPQDPSDEPAEKLLERIREEKQRLVKEGKIKKDKHESIIFRRDNSHYEKLDGIERCIDDETPFEIPANWEWARLGSIAIVQSSKRVFEKDYVDKGIPFFRSKEIGDLYRGEEIHTQLFITREHYERLKKDYGVPKSGDILITSVGTIGNSWICDGREFYYKDGNITQICSNSYLFSQYIQLFINSPLFIEQAQSTVSGTAYNALTIVKLKNMLIPVPPLLEQRRIVEKQRELFDKITLI